MSAIDSLRVKRFLAGCWLGFAIVNITLMYLLPGEETIPYHLTWASFALLYGLYRWSLTTTWLTFGAITVATGIAIVLHARDNIIGWEECSEIVLMGVLVALLIWHVRRFQESQRRLAELRESDRQHAEQREIAARFGSHEVRTRLTIARGFAELIQGRAEDELTRSDATVVLTELDKASALATMLLALVRVESPVPRVPLNLAELIEAVLARWRVTAERQWQMDVRVGMMLGDSERIESALDCLIENAVKFTDSSDTIRVEAMTSGNDVQLRVVDTGSGIMAEDLPRVAEIFHTGSTAGDRAGSGLGLSIVRAIVEARGGHLQVESQPNQGTAITLHIPGAHPAARPDRDTARPTATGSAEVAQPV